MLRDSRRIFFLLFLLGPAGAPAAAPVERRPALLEREYAGRFPDAFNAHFDRVRLLARQAQLEISSRLGLLQYREGFQYPLAIRFADEVPAGLEHALAYVRLGRTATGFAQELVIHLEQTARHSLDFDEIFFHEMTHAVLNDAVGGDASERIPPWIQEGLAMQLSGEGERRLKEVAGQFRRSQVDRVLADLDGPYVGTAYPQYYLALRYLQDKQTSNAVQALVRNLIQGRTVPEAIEDATGLAWPALKERIREYSLRVLQGMARPDF